MALLAEAKPFIKTLKLSLELQSPFQIYGNETIKLIITGMGKDNALMATTYLLTKFSPADDDLLVNFGLAGAQKEFDIGSLVFIHAYTDAQSGKSFYPDMRLTHPYKEVPLTTVSQVQTTIDPTIQVVDMEAFAVYTAGLLFLKSSKILTFKLISDHFSAVVPSKQQVDALIQPHVETLRLLLDNQQSKLPKKLLFSITLNQEIAKTISTLKLTTTQENQLNDRVKGFILKHKKEPLLPKNLSEFNQHKKEQKDAFNKLIDLLSL